MDPSFYENFVAPVIADSSLNLSPSSDYGSLDTSPGEKSLSTKVLKPSLARFLAEGSSSTSLPKNIFNSMADDAFVILSDIPIEEIEINEGLFRVPLAPVDAVVTNKLDYGNNILHVDKEASRRTSSRWNFAVSERAPTPSIDGRSFGWDLWIRKAIHQSITSPPCPKRTEGPPFLNILCNQSYNLSKQLVTLVIRIHNLPRVLAMTSEMFDAIAVSPTGRRQPCLVHHVDNLMARSFPASFKAGEETGFYEVQVKLVNPMLIGSVVKDGAQDGGVLTGSIKIPVSRNFCEDSRIAKVIISCDYTPTQAPVTHSAMEDEDYRRCKLWGLTTNLSTNNLFYTDRFGDAVRCVDPWGNLLFKFGDLSENSSKQLACPTGISFDHTHGRLLVVDKDNHRVCFFSADGEFISSFGSKGRGKGMFLYPWDVAVSPDGTHIVVSDPGNRRIQLFDRYGNFQSVYSVFDTNPTQYKYHLDQPRGVTFDETGNTIYVTDFAVNNVSVIPLDFSQHHKLLPPGHLCRPQGITVDDCGNLLITDSWHDCVRHLTPKGDLMTSVTNVLDRPIKFPMNVTTLAGGYVAVLDRHGKIFIY